MGKLSVPIHLQAIAFNIFKSKCTRHPIYSTKTFKSNFRMFAMFAFIIEMALDTTTFRKRNAIFNITKSKRHISSNTAHNSQNRRLLLSTFFPFGLLFWLQSMNRIKRMFCVSVCVLTTKRMHESKKKIWSLTQTDINFGFIEHLNEQVTSPTQCPNWHPTYSNSLNQNLIKSFPSNPSEMAQSMHSNMFQHGK